MPAKCGWLASISGGQCWPRPLHWLLQWARGASLGVRARLRGHRLDGEAALHLSPLEQVSLALVRQWRFTAKPGGWRGAA